MKAKLTALLVGVVVMGLASSAMAVSYASGAVKTGDDVSFVLNQDAYSVQAILDGGAQTLNLSTTKGTINFNMAGYSTYQIKVSSYGGAAGWTQFSDDSLTQSKYYSPRGVAVDINPARSTFGQIIVAEALGGAVGAGGRTTTDGLYIMSADQGDITGQGDTAYAGGVDWATGGSSSPFKVSMNRSDPSDHTIYIGDWSDGHSGIWTADLLNPATAFNALLDNTGRDAAGIVLENNGAGPGQLHGSVPVGPWVEGTGANRAMYTVDEDVGLGNVWQYNIGTTTSGYSTAPTARVTDGPNIILNGLADVVRDDDGSWWIAQYRYTDADAAPSLSHWADNSSTPSWISGDSTFHLDLAYGSLDINGDGNLLVMGTRGGTMYVLDISDPNNPVLVDTITHSGSYVRDVAFDAAGNIYAVSSSSETLRIYEPGGWYDTILGSDGTFVVVPEPTTLTLLGLGGLALLLRRRR